MNTFDNIWFKVKSWRGLPIVFLAVTFLILFVPSAHAQVQVDPSDGTPGGIQVERDAPPEPKIVSPYCFDGSHFVQELKDINGTLAWVWHCEPWPTHCLNGLPFYPPTLIHPEGSCSYTWSRDWDRRAVCETGHNPPKWDTNTGNGYYGGLQMTKQFWKNYGGLKFADRADHASSTQQKLVAEVGLRSEGDEAWPGCFHKGY
jgi:hypothetical protein